MKIRKNAKKKKKEKEKQIVFAIHSQPLSHTKTRDIKVVALFGLASNLCTHSDTHAIIQKSALLRNWIQKNIHGLSCEPRCVFCYRLTFLFRLRYSLHTIGRNTHSRGRRWFGERVYPNTHQCILRIYHSDRVPTERHTLTHTLVKRTRSYTQSKWVK